MLNSKHYFESNLNVGGTIEGTSITFVVDSDEKIVNKKENSRITYR